MIMGFYFGEGDWRLFYFILIFWFILNELIMDMVFLKFTILSSVMHSWNLEMISGDNEDCT